MRSAVEQLREYIREVEEDRNAATPLMFLDQAELCHIRLTWLVAQAVAEIGAHLEAISKAWDNDA